MIAILSNTNCDPIIRKVAKQAPCVESTGYGNVLEALLNPASNVSTANPDMVVLIVDTREFIQNASDYKERIETFFADLQGALRAGVQYYISDAYYYIGYDTDFKGTGIPRRASMLWDQRLIDFVDANKNCYVFPFSRCVADLGESAFFSDKAWNLGSVRYSAQGISHISQEVLHIAQVAAGKSKKVLLLDLDNTLWGGVAGEDGIKGIKLADSGIGKAYKEFQTMLRCMKDCGAALAIVSKNNETDAWEILENHPHMLIRKDDLAAYRINWNSKADNIRQLAAELNVGLDSMVFIDDNPLERQEVKELIPEVIVPDFPTMPEELPRFGRSVLETWFQKNEITNEDREKTKQYQMMHEIAQARDHATDYPSFLKGLRIRVTRKDPKAHIERVVQLVQKTNQFNTTVSRYAPGEIENMLSGDKWQVFLYEVEDRFANHGLCAEAFVRFEDVPVIENFIMSCRVMGRNIEYGILKDVEDALARAGYTEVRARYRKGPKNMPVEFLFDQAGYAEAERKDDEKEYRKALAEDDATESKFVGEVIQA